MPLPSVKVVGAGDLNVDAPNVPSLLMPPAKVTFATETAVASKSL